MHGRLCTWLHRRLGGLREWAGLVFPQRVAAARFSEARGAVQGAWKSEQTAGWPSVLTVAHLTGGPWEGCCAGAGPWLPPLPALLAPPFHGTPSLWQDHWRAF